MSTKAKQRPDFHDLYMTASLQLGLFTAQQAVEAGYSRPSHSYHVKKGDWVREDRGIYRLRYFPYHGWQDIMQVYLWSSDINGKPQGVISHDTALRVHDLSTWVGCTDYYYLTVPKNFRRRGQTLFQLRLHYDQIPESEMEERNGFIVTKPLRTILDLLFEQRLERRHVKDALRDALDKYLILPQDISSLSLPDDKREELKQFLRFVGNPVVQNLL
jgi:hypothetical protein